MPCTGIITPTGNAPTFTDRFGFSHPIYRFEPGTITGTIFLLLGGTYGGGGPGVPLAITTKGFDTTGSGHDMTSDECNSLKNLRDLGWRCLMFQNDETFVSTDTTTKSNQWWIEDLCKWMDNTYTGGVGRFLVGHSAGAGLVGVHLHHIQTGQGLGTWGTGALSFPFPMNDANKLTDFQTSTFNGKNTLFVSGKSGSDTIGYQNTKDMFNIACPSTGKSGHEAINTDHNVFSLVNSSTGRRLIVDIIHNFFVNYSSASLYCQPTPGETCDKCGFT